MQHTIATPVTISGVGLHSGQKATIVMEPADPNCGVLFQRVDLSDTDNTIAARYDRVIDTRLNTRIGNDTQVCVGTIEHLMAALSGLGIDNVLVKIDGPEVPILDGSSLEFIRPLLAAGRVAQNEPKRIIKILKPIEILWRDASASLHPSDLFGIDFSIDFDDPAIGQQSKTLNMANGSFVRELSNCRTFCRFEEIETLQAHGLARGGGLHNAIVVRGDKILNPDGFRHPDECVRHKMLDVMGDLYLAGAPILGRYQSQRGGHHVTNLLLRALFDTPDAWEWVTCDATLATRLPGSDLTDTDLSVLNAA